MFSKFLCYSDIHFKLLEFVAWSELTSQWTGSNLFQICEVHKLLIKILITKFPAKTAPFLIEPTFFIDVEL